jgi:hypothetical protein
MQRSQQQMVTLVNGSFGWSHPGIRIAGVAPATDVPDVRGGATFLAVVVVRAGVRADRSDQQQN